MTISFNILGWILVPSSALDRLKRQAVAAICMGNTDGYSLAQDRTFYNSTVCWSGAEQGVRRELT